MLRCLYSLEQCARTETSSSIIANNYLQMRNKDSALKRMQRSNVKLKDSFSYVSVIEVMKSVLLAELNMTKFTVEDVTSQIQSLSWHHPLRATHLSVKLLHFSSKHDKNENTILIIFM